MMEAWCAGMSRFCRTAVAGSLASLPLAAATAGAAELKLPQARPLVALDVPDAWTIVKTGKALDARSPEKDAIIVAEVIARDKLGLDAWAKQASEKLKTFGISFDPKATAPATTAPVEDESAFTKSPDKFTFSGSPSLATPGTPGSNDPVKPPKNSIETLTGLGAEGKLAPAPKPTVAKTPMPKLPFKAVQYYGTTLNGKPVDVQLLTYSLPEKRLFVMMQESGPEDGRAVAIAASVRGVKAPPRAPAKKAPPKGPAPADQAPLEPAPAPAAEAAPSPQP